MRALARAVGIIALSVVGPVREPSPTGETPSGMAKPPCAGGGASLQQRELFAPSLQYYYGDAEKTAQVRCLVRVEQTRRAHLLLGWTLI